MSKDSVSYQVFRSATERQVAPKGGLDWYYREDTEKTGMMVKPFFVFRRQDNAE